jgi:hypothetical protein
MQAFPLFFVFQIPGCRNAENVLVFVLSGFRDSGNHDARVPPFPFRTPGFRNVEMPKCPNTYPFGFSRFAKSGCRGYLCFLESPVVEIPKCRDVEMPWRSINDSQ